METDNKSDTDNGPDWNHQACMDLAHALVAVTTTQAKDTTLLQLLRSLSGENAIVMGHVIETVVQVTADSKAQADAIRQGMLTALLIAGDIGTSSSGVKNVLRKCEDRIANVAVGDSRQVPWPKGLVTDTDKKPDRHVTNADNRFLEPLHGFIGSVDEVNGPGAAEITQFIPTRHELLMLVKHYEEEALYLEYFSFLHAQYGSDWSRKISFARRRIARIAALLGREGVQEVVDKVMEEFGNREDKEAWDIFLHGSPEDRKRLQDRIQRDLESSQGKDPPRT